MKKRGGLQETDRRDDHCQLRAGKVAHGDPVQDLQVREDNDKKSNLVDLFMRRYNYDRPHMLLDWEYQETPAQAFERKMLGEGQTVVDGQGITPGTVLRMSS